MSIRSVSDRSVSDNPALGSGLAPFPVVPVSSRGSRICQRIRLQIPAQYAQQPIISALCRYEVEVNIRGALLATQAQESGWFDLELLGTPERVQQGLDYLSGLEVEIWYSGCIPHRDKYKYGLSRMRE